MKDPVTVGHSSTHFWQAAAVVWTAFVVSMAITPIHNVELITESLSDKVLHAAAFLVGSMVWAGTLKTARGEWFSVGMAVVICLLLGAAIEIMQTQTETRQAEAGDFVFDAAGAVVGVVIWEMARRGIRTRKSSPEGVSEESRL